MIHYEMGLLVNNELLFRQGLMWLTCCSRGLQAMQRLPTTQNGREHRPNAKMMQGPVRPGAASVCMVDVGDSVILNG